MIHASFYQDCNTHQIFMNHWSKIHGTSKHSRMYVFSVFFPLYQIKHGKIKRAIAHVYMYIVYIWSNASTQTKDVRCVGCVFRFMFVLALVRFACYCAHFLSTLFVFHYKINVILRAFFGSSTCLVTT